MGQDREAANVALMQFKGTCQIDGQMMLRDVLLMPVAH